MNVQSQNHISFSNGKLKYFVLPWFKCEFYLFYQQFVNLYNKPSLHNNPRFINQSKGHKHKEK